MDFTIIFHVLFTIALSSICGLQVILGLDTTFEEEEAKINLRRELDKMTQELWMEKDPFYHSYVFNSGVGNRERLEVESMRQYTRFTAGEEVLSWLAVRNIDQIHLLGRKLSSVTLVTAGTQLSSNRSAQFTEHSIDLEASVTGMSLFTRWNPDTSEPEVFAVIAVDTSASDIMFYRVSNGKLEHMTQWSYYRKVSCLTAVNVEGEDQLIVIDAGSPTSIDVFKVEFKPGSVKLNFRLKESFTEAGECKSMAMCRVGGQHYLVLPLPQHIVIYRLASSHYQRHTELSLPRVSQVVCFNVALQSYLAINGEAAHVLRLTESGDFVPELIPGYVSEWLVLPVSSYRSDVLLLSRSAGLINAYVWAGTNKGFDTITIPECDSCLEGDWSGAVSVPFQHQNCLMIPQPQRSSSLVIVEISLHDNNPVLDKLKTTLENMKKYQDEWQQIKSKMAGMEETLRYVVKHNGTNVITGKWTIENLKSQRLTLNSLVQPQTVANLTDEAVGTEETGPIPLETLEYAVHKVVAQGKELIKAVEQREKEVWGLDGFRGKVTFKSHLFVDKLTVSNLNNEPMDQLLHNTFRKDKPEPIQLQVVIKKLDAEDVVVNKINNFASDNLKFSDGPVMIRGNVTFEGPLTVRGDVELTDGGRVNDVDLSEELCHGLESCSVFPTVNLTEEEVRNGDMNNNIEYIPSASSSDLFWTKIIAGRNLTVMKINGVDWKTLAENVVYRNTYQNISGTVVVRGKVTSDTAIWADSIQYLHKSQPRTPNSGTSSEILDASGSEKRPAYIDRTILDHLLTAPEIIVSKLEVTGTVSCGETDWGAEAADVVLSNVDPIVIKGDKTFSDAISVTNNAEVEDTIGGVIVSDLLTRDTNQIFNGPTVLHGDVTFENVTLTGLWNGKNVSDVSEVSTNSNKYMSDGGVTADSITVQETINGVPIRDVVFTDDDKVIKLKTVDVETLYVTKDIVVNGKVCNENLNDFNEKRLSLQKEQNITGKVLIDEAKVTRNFQVTKLNDIEISSLVGDSNDPEATKTLYLSELHIDGDIVTDQGVNGFNLTEVAADAVWLESNNDIEGPLIFMDEISCDILESQGFCNNKGCDYWLSVNDVVFKNNKSVTFSGKKRFVNLVNISGDLTVQEINSHKAEDILTKTTEQEIKGDLIISGDVKVTSASTVLGLLNGQNITELGHRCSLSRNTITCTGNAVFKDGVTVNHFNTSGKINGIKFDSFLKSVVRTDEPQQIKGFKRFIGNTVVVENLEDVDRLNGESWDDFLSDSVNVGGQEQVDHPVMFTDTLSVRQLSVDYHMQVDTVNEINITEWKTDAIYINESRNFLRDMRLASASSKGNLTVTTYGGLDIEFDLVKLNMPSTLFTLHTEQITVLDSMEVLGLVNGNRLEELERNTLKTRGDQIVQSDVLVLGEVVIDGNLETMAPVNQYDLRDVVTLASDQTLHGKYTFDCVEAQGDISSSEVISGINLTSWTQTGVLKNESKQVISGVWRIQGPLDLKGPVKGKGRLADTNLRQLTDNITRDVLHVHRQMKANLSEACEEANAQLASARSQTCKLHYLDVTQTFLVPSGPSLVTHFKSGDEDFLVISEKSCITTIYKWNKNEGIFSILHREMFGFSLKNFILLNNEQRTYVVTESSELPSDCEYSGKNLWVFIKENYTFQHVSSVDFYTGDMFQGEGTSLYVVNSLGMFKYALHFEYSKAFFQSEPHHWNITTDVPKEWFSAVQYEWLSDVYTASNCSGEVISVSVDPGRQFLAVAATEVAQVPRHADYIKVYRKDGRLFDKLPARSVNHLQWLAVPAQTWLVALQNHSALNLYQLQGELLGFQLQVSATVDATNIATVALPLAAKVNPQPFVILQTLTAIKLVRAFVQGDPYLGANLTCSFDQVLNRVPRK